MEKNHQLLLPAGLGPDRVLSQVAEKFSVKKSRPSAVHRQYFDSFDWRLFFRNLQLYREGGAYVLADLSGEIKAEASWDSKKPLRFWEELEAGPLRDELAPILDMRALLPRARARLSGRTITILNPDVKVVLRLMLELFFPARQKAPALAILRLLPVRGYLQELHEMEGFLAGLGLKPDDNASGMRLFFAAAGQAVAAYSTKINVSLQAEQTAGTAAIAIFRSQLAVMQQNVAGVRADIDSEFLHDFRVAMRRTRAGLSQIRGVFSEAVVNRFKKELGEIGQMTNRLRDLDVYLLKRRDYSALLPEPLRPGLESLFAQLAAEQRQEQRRLSRWLNGPAFQEIMDDWREFLDSYAPGADADGPAATQPVLDLARRFIAKAHNRVMKQGRKIDENSAKEEMHSLRLACKKLRYLLEFFASLFPANEMNLLVGQVKKLQQNLGDFNDLSVQQQTLFDYLEHRLSSTGKPLLETAAAIGGLIATLNARQQVVRQAFAATFNGFDTLINNKLFAELFGSKKP